MAARETTMKFSYDKKPQNYTKTTNQHLIVRSGKTEALLTIINDSARGITLLKVTNGHELDKASATARLLVS